MSRSVSSCLLAIALLAIAVTISSPALAQQDDIRVVYRIDTRPPADVFRQGLFGRGSSVGVLGHVLEGRCDDNAAQRTAWVSTTASLREATDFAWHRLVYAGASGPENRLWLYEIRPDSSFISVPGVLGQAIDVAELGLWGYVPAHADRIRQLMNRSSIRWDQEVLARHVSPSNIVRATAVYRSAGMLLQAPPVANQAYVAADTQASHTVDDLATYVPIASVDTTPAANAPSCSMTCDGATSASSLAAGSALADNPDGYCVAYRKSAMTPEKLQIILD